MNFYASKEYYSEFWTETERKFNEDYTAITEDIFFDIHLKKVKEEYRKLPEDENPKRKWREKAERKREERAKKLEVQQNKPLN